MEGTKNVFKCVESMLLVFLTRIDTLFKYRSSVIPERDLYSEMDHNIGFAI